MKLTGKCKTDFEQYVNDFMYDRFESMHHISSLDETCKNALIIEFFDSVKYNGVNLWGYCFSFFYKYKIESQRFNDICNQSIEKANQLYNEQ